MAFPTLPMGTLMAVLMLLTALTLGTLDPQASHRGLRRLWRVAIGALAASGAVWQIAWYASRHLGTLWGAMATLSGLALVVAAVLLLPRTALDAWARARWPIVALLAGLALFYAVTIVRLP